ncbi:F-box domain-containing protein [Ilyonectria robusta]
MSRGDTVGDFPFRNICNWSHSVPPKHFLFSRADYEDESIMYMESCKHLSAITFGGSDGQDLSKLVEIAMCSFGVGSVAGFEFVYNDSSRRSFGRLEPLPLGFNLQQIPSEPERVVLSIDGPGGERIDNIQIQRGVAVKVNGCRVNLSLR